MSVFCSVVQPACHWSECESPRRKNWGANWYNENLKQGDTLESCSNITKFLWILTKLQSTSELTQDLGCFVNSRSNLFLAFVLVNPNAILFCIGLHHNCAWLYFKMLFPQRFQWNNTWTHHQSGRNGWWQRRGVARGVECLRPVQVGLSSGPVHGCPRVRCDRWDMRCPALTRSTDRNCGGDKERRHSSINTLTLGHVALTLNV